MNETNNITDRVKTFEDAVKELGKDHPFVKQYNLLLENGYVNQKNIDAFLKLRIITTALNEGWKPKFSEDEDRYYPSFCPYTQKEADKMSKDERDKLSLLDKPISARFAYSYHVPSLMLTLLDSRLCFKTRKLAQYAGKQFIDIYTDFLLLNK